MSGYGPLYWPWSCPMAAAGRTDANSSNSTVVAADVFFFFVVVPLAVVVTATDERILQTAAGAPVRRVTAEVTRGRTAAVAAGGVARLPRSLTIASPPPQHRVMTPLIGRRRLSELRVAAAAATATAAADATAAARRASSPRAADGTTVFSSARAYDKRIRRRRYRRRRRVALLPRCFR